MGVPTLKIRPSTTRKFPKCVPQWLSLHSIAGALINATHKIQHTAENCPNLSLCCSITVLPLYTVLQLLEANKQQEIANICTVATRKHSVKSKTFPMFPWCRDVPYSTDN